MSFNASIPLITDPILQSSRQIRANFQAINAAFATNHVTLTQDPSLSGMHTALTMRPQGSDPTTSATEIAFYNKLVSNIPEIFFRPSSNQTPIQMTYPSLKVDGSTSQYSFVAGPFIVYGGLITAPTNGQVVSLSPGANLLYVDLTAIGTGATFGVTPTNLAANTFTISFTPPLGTFNVFYFALGN